LKKVIDANSGLAASAQAGEKAFDAVVEPHRKLARDRGNTMFTLGDAEFKRWIQASESVDDDWIKDVTAKGADGKKLIEEARSLITLYEK
jgi:hypothetical protein